MIKNEYTYRIILEGGHLSQTSGFWKKFDNDEDKKVDTQKKKPGDLNEETKEGIFVCPDRLCSEQFLTIEGLRKHKFKVQHNRRKDTESTIDAGDCKYLLIKTLVVIFFIFLFFFQLYDSTLVLSRPMQLHRSL